MSKALTTNEENRVYLANKEQISRFVDCGSLKDVIINYVVNKIFSAVKFNNSQNNYKGSKPVCSINIEKQA
jgi:hypothetical protein